MIEELDLVALLTDLPAPNGSPMRLRRGDVGTVIHIYGGGNLYEVEFINANGETVGVETLNANEVRAVNLGRVILHYSDLESAA